MQFKNRYIQKFWRFSTSFQLGIPVLVALTVLITYGTIVESIYNDALAAQKIVYKSIWMYITMGLLIYNLTIVMVDRWPWKKKHTAFILVHIGIITLILGGWVTQKFGLDGSMAIPIQGKNNYVTVPETDLVIYATFTGDRYTKFFDKEVDFFTNPPTPEKPLEISLGKSKIVFSDYYKYARVSKKLLTTDDNKAGSSVKIQLQNANVTQVEVLTQPKFDKSTDVNLGPLKIHLGHKVNEFGRKFKNVNEIYLLSKTPEKIEYFLFRKEEDKAFKTGLIEVGDVVQTGWMGLELRLIDYLERAVEEWQAVKAEVMTPLTTAAVQMEYAGKKQWLLLNDVIKIFSEDSAYLVSYQNRRIDLGFPVALKKFEKTNYEGTEKAKEYASLVQMQASNLPPIEGLIQMNEPINYAGFRFYQASFNQDEKSGEIKSSVLSVNFDPGRWIKYLGSLILSVGIIMFFVQNRKRKTAL